MSQASQEVSSNVTVVAPAKNSLLMEPVEDVELPAGRLFSEQLQHDADDDWTDDASEDEVFSSKKNMWDDWRESVLQKYEENERKIDDELDFEIKERMENIFRQEEGAFF